MLFQTKKTTRGTYLQGVGWMILMCMISNANDIIMKKIGSDFQPEQIAFCRFFFSAVILLPFMVLKGTKSFKTKQSGLHWLRGGLLVVSMTLWAYGVSGVPLTTATSISFTIPFFILPLARIFLGERVSTQRWMAVLMGFTGTVIVLKPLGSDIGLHAISLIVSVIIFSLLDIINKKMLTDEEPLISMLFYTALYTSIIGFLPAYNVWVTPEPSQFMYFILLGAGANLTLFCLLKAYKLADVSSIQPIRYFELVLSIFWGILIFNEHPSLFTIIGSSFIILSGIYLVKYETRSTSKSASQINS